MKKNIVLIISALNMGGAQRTSSALANNWSKNGHKVTVICTYDGKIKRHYDLDENINLIKLSKNLFFYKNKYLNLIWKLFSLRRLIKSQDPDIVISFLARINVAAALSTLGIKSLLIICERSWPPFVSLNKRIFWVFRILFKRADKIIVQTEKSKSWLSINLPSSNVEVIPNPVLYPIPFENESIIAPNSIVLDSKKIILASGRLHKVKQFDLLIKAYSIIEKAHPNWDLVILGDGEDKKFLKSMLKDLKIAGRVFLPGNVGNVADWYERADLFVLSSLVEGFPNVLLEAMSYGVTSISFDCNTGPKEMIENEVNGILVNPEEKEIGLSKAMKKMITHEKDRTKLSNNSVLLRKKYSINNIMQKWNDTLGI